MAEDQRKPQRSELVERRSATDAIIASGVLAGGLGGLAAGAAQLKQAFGGKQDAAEQAPADQAIEAAQQDK
jgi:hypothetical protein